MQWIYMNIHIYIYIYIYYIIYTYHDFWMPPRVWVSSFSAPGPPLPDLEEIDVGDPCWFAASLAWLICLLPLVLPWGFLLNCWGRFAENRCFTSLFSLLRISNAIIGEWLSFFWLPRGCRCSGGMEQPAEAKGAGRRWNGGRLWLTGFLAHLDVSSSSHRLSQVYWQRGPEILRLPVVNATAASAHIGSILMIVAQESLANSLTVTCHTDLCSHILL